MNTYSLESFISFCDDMMIAEEGLFKKKFAENKCSNCGRMRKPLESYENIIDGDTTYHICVDCSKLIYKIRDAYLDEKNPLKALDFTKKLQNRNKGRYKDFSKVVDQMIHEWSTKTSSNKDTFNELTEQQQI